MTDAGFVVRRLTNHRSRSFRKNHHLLALGQCDACASDHVLQRTLACASLDGDATQACESPSEKRYEHQFAFQYVNWTIKDREQRTCVPDRLMLHGQKAAAVRYVLFAPNFIIDPANCAVHGEPNTRPEFGERRQRFRRNERYAGGRHGADGEQAVEQNRKYEGTKN